MYRPKNRAFDGAIALAVLLALYLLISGLIAGRKESARQERIEHYRIAQTAHLKSFAPAGIPDSTVVRLRIELKHWMDSLAQDTL